ncbi:MAG: paraquat-inducible protein A [Chromatiales bacterium]|nr:paraquat-inducible protein A [Chromatiales bacterium]
MDDPVTPRAHACPGCDLIVGRVETAKAHTARCPRCASVVYRFRPRAAERAVALSFAGLMLWWPAVLLPIMRLDALGRAREVSMTESVAALLAHGDWDVALWVALFGLIAPLVQLGVHLLVNVAVLRRRTGRKSARALRVLHGIEEWGMLEIYLLGVMVSMIKLRDLAAVHVGGGLIALGALFVVLIALQRVEDRDSAWNGIARPHG